MNLFEFSLGIVVKGWIMTPLFLLWKNLSKDNKEDIIYYVSGVNCESESYKCFLDSILQKQGPIGITY